VSIAAVHARIAELQVALAPRPVEAPPAAFTGALQGAVASAPAAAGLGPTAGAPAAMPSAPGTPAGQAIVNAIRNEVGQSEQPPGSNNSPRIAQYRQSTAGSAPGQPWCAYFASWAARQAGVPVGEQGQGFGSVDALYDWAQRAGKATPAADAKPQPGDLIVWDEHIGIVESVNADGSVTTIEGNSSDKVSRRTHPPGGGGAIGYVRLG